MIDGVRSTPESPQSAGGSHNPGESRSPGWEIGALIALTAAALAVRWVAIGHRELWLDEAFTVLVARSEGWGELLRRVAADNYPPLYFLGMRVWLTVLGFGAAAARWPSALAGVALVPLTWELVREADRIGEGTRRDEEAPAAEAGPGARLAAAAVAGFSPLLLHYSLEARPYRLLWLLATGILIGLFRFERSRDPGGTDGLVLAGALTALGLGIHYFTVLLAPVWGWVAWTARGRRRRVLATGLVAALPVGVWALGVADWPRGSTAWLVWLWRGPVDALWTSLKAFSLVGFPETLRALGRVEIPGAPLAWALGVWFGGPVVLGIAHGLRRDPRRGGILPLAALGPALLLALLSLHTPLYLAGRYEVLGYPAWIALWALGLARGVDRVVRWDASKLSSRGRRPRRLAWGGGGLVTALGLCAVLSLYLRVSPGPGSRRQVARKVAASGDAAVIAVGLAKAPLQVYLWGLGSPVEPLSFSTDLEEHPGWMDLPRYSADELLADARNLQKRIGHEPVWVVSSVGPDRRPLEPRLIEALAKAFLSDSHRLGKRLEVPGFAVWFLQPVREPRAGPDPRTVPARSRDPDGIVPP